MTVGLVVTLRTIVTEVREGTEFISIILEVVVTQVTEAKVRSLVTAFILLKVITSVTEVTEVAEVTQNYYSNNRDTFTTNMYINSSSNSIEHIASS